MSPASNRRRAPRRNPISQCLALLLSSYLLPVAHAADFPPTSNLLDLVGNGALRLDGVAGGDATGRSVSGAGDINGDGLDDIAIAAPGADPNGTLSGSSYVVLGRPGGLAALGPGQCRPRALLQALARVASSDMSIFAKKKRRD